MLVPIVLMGPKIKRFDGPAHQEGLRIVIFSCISLDPLGSIAEHP